MPDLNFILIGRIPGQSLFIYKDDSIYLSNKNSSSQIKCIAIDFITRRSSFPVTIEQMENICPHDPVTSDENEKFLQNYYLRTSQKRR